MSKFQKISTGVSRQSAILGTDIGSGGATSVQFLAADGSGNSAFRSIVLGDFPSIASNTILGNNTGGSTTPSALTVAQVNAILPVFTSSLNGLVPASGGGTTNFLRADGTWAVAGSGTVTSVAVSVPATSIFGVTGSPITTSGTIGITTTGTSGGIPYFSSTSALSSSALLTASQLIIGGGSGTAPSTLAAGSQFQVLVMGASNPGYGAVNLAQSAAVTGTLPNANTTATNAATASTIASRDANANTRVNSLIEGFTTTATAAGTTTLTVSSTHSQQFTGTTTQTVVLPDATTLVVGQAFMIMNRSTGVVTVNANGGGLVQTMAAGSQTVVTAVTIGTSAGTWDSAYSVTAAAAGGAATRAGSQAIGSASTSQAVTFSSSMANTSYAISAQMINTTDTGPQFQPVTITAQSTSGFTATWNMPTATANYSLTYIVMANN